MKIHTKEPCNFEVSIESQVSFGYSKLGFLKRLFFVAEDIITSLIFEFPVFCTGRVTGISSQW